MIQIVKKSILFTVLFCSLTITFLCWGEQPNEWFINPQTGEADYYHSEAQIQDFADDTCVKQDGTTPLTADWNMGAYDLTGGVDATFTGTIISEQSIFGDGGTTDYSKFDTDGDLTFNGSADYLVALNDWCFRYSGNESAGLYFSSTNTGQISVMDTGGDECLSFGAANGSTDGHIFGDSDIILRPTSTYVGINNTSPSVALDVTGDATFTGAVSIDSDTYGLILGDDQDATIKWDNTESDVSLDEDLNLISGTNNPEPHLRFTPTSGDEIEIFATSDEIRCTNYTDGTILWQVKPDETFNLDDNDLTTTGTVEGTTLTEGGNAIYNSSEIPGGELGGTWASPTVDSSIHDDEYIELDDNFAGDITGTYDATVVGDDSHAHTGTSLSGIDISDDTNLTAGDHITLTDDDLDVDDDFLLNTGDTAAGDYDITGIITATQFTDGIATLTGGNLASMGNITGTDVDISAGTGDFTSSGKADIGTLDLGTNTLVDAQLGRVLDDFKRLSVQSAKITGSFVTVGATIDAGDPEWKGLFDDTTEEQMLWHFTLPQTYSGTLVARIPYSMAGANTSKKIDWEVSIMAVADGENITTSSFDTLNEVSGGTTVPATADLLDTITITLTNADNIAAGETCFVKINRDTDDSDDNAVGDAQLHDLFIEWVR